MTPDRKAEVRKIVEEGFREPMTAISEALSDLPKYTRLDSVSEKSYRTHPQGHVVYWRDYKALVDHLLPYKEELLKIAADVGETDDPFAAWEAIQSLRSGNGGEVRVKALEWEDAGEEEWTAESLCGSYYLPLIGSRYNVLLNCAGNGGMFQTRLAEALDIDEAKAFCEADNRTRIRSALDIKP